MEETFVQIKRL